MVDVDMIFELFIKELYGVDVKDILKLDKLCKKHDIFWYDLVYADESLFDEFVDYFVNKYKLRPKWAWIEKISFLYLDYGPTSSKERYQESLDKVRGDKEIQEILDKINVFGSDRRG